MVITTLQTLLEKLELTNSSKEAGHKNQYKKSLAFLHTDNKPANARKPEKTLLKQKENA